MKSVLAVCLSPTFQRMLVFPSFAENEVNRSTQVLEIASGKGINVSRVLNLLGRPCTNLIQLGGRRVPEFLDLCLQDGLDVVYLPVEADIRTCTTVINEKDHTSTELVEEARTVEENDSERFFSLFLSLYRASEKNEHFTNLKLYSPYQQTRLVAWQSDARSFLRH